MAFATNITKEVLESCATREKNCCENPIHLFADFGASNWGGDISHVRSNSSVRSSSCLRASRVSFPLVAFANNCDNVEYR